MNGRRTTAGLLLLCALILGVSAASSAAAATGTTAVTCVKKTTVGGEGFSKAHCKEADKVSTGAAFEHVTITGETKEVEATNAGNGAATETTVAPVLKGKIAGVAATLTATSMTTTSSLVNVAGPPMKVDTPVITITWGNVTLTVGPKGCKVVGGTIKSGELSGESVKETMEFQFKPPASGVFAEFSLEGCEQAANNGPYKITGTARAISDGATRETTEASTAGLKLAGQAVSLTSVSTVKMKAGNPIGATTVE